MHGTSETRRSLSGSGNKSAFATPTSQHFLAGRPQKVFAHWYAGHTSGHPFQFQVLLNLPGVEGILVKQLGQYARFLEYGLWFMDVQPVVYNPGG